MGEAVQLAYQIEDDLKKRDPIEIPKQAKDRSKRTFVEPIRSKPVDKR